LSVRQIVYMNKNGGFDEVTVHIDGERDRWPQLHIGLIDQIILRNFV